MRDVVLFHHARGVGTFAEQLRTADHTVTTPDLLDGNPFAGVEQGVAHAESIGFAEIAELGASIAPASARAFAGLSLGALPAQKLSQNRSDAVGLLTYHSAIPMGVLGDTWPPHLFTDSGAGDYDVASAAQLIEPMAFFAAVAVS